MKLKLPKLLRNWIKRLNKSLNLLEENDRKDIIEAYIEKFQEELAAGRLPAQIYTELEPIEDITNNVYLEFLTPKQLESKRAKKTLKKSREENKTNQKIEKEDKKITSRTLRIFAAIFMWLFTFILALISVAIPIVMVFYVVISFENYDSSLIWPVVMAIIGCGILFTPLFMLLTKAMFRGSQKTIDIFNKFEKKKFGFKPWIIIIAITTIIGGSLAGVGTGIGFNKDQIFDRLVTGEKYRKEIVMNDKNDLKKLLEKDEVLDDEFKTNFTEAIDNKNIYVNISYDLGMDSGYRQIQLDKNQDFIITRFTLDKIVMKNYWEWSFMIGYNNDKVNYFININLKPYWTKYVLSFGTEELQTKIFQYRQ